MESIEWFTLNLDGDDFGTRAAAWSAESNLTKSEGTFAFQKSRDPAEFECAYHGARRAQP